MMHKKTTLGVWESFVHVKRLDLTFRQQSEVVVFETKWQSSFNRYGIIYNLSSLVERAGANCSYAVWHRGTW